MPIACALVALCCAAAVADTGGTRAAPARATASPTAQLSKWQQQQRAAFANSAPADEYFGKMKMSYLGIDNTFRDAAISSGDHTTDPKIINKISLAEDALDAWGAKYPRDPQLARSYYLAVAVERKIWVKANQDRAWDYFNRIVQLFPDTYFGKLMQRDLAIGFTEHYYADATVCATPAPTASPSPTPEPTATPTPEARRRRGPSPTPSPSPTPTDTPTPEPTPTPLPSPMTTTLGPKHSVQIIPVPCVSPSPAASAAS